EGIDRGPVDAIVATGATRLQVLRFGVLPQVLPLFLSYILYRLESNIRAATILGFVGAGGIGFYLQTYLRMIDSPAASTALLVTVAMVMLGDFASSRLRARLVQRRHRGASAPPRPREGRGQSPRPSGTPARRVGPPRARGRSGRLPGDQGERRRRAGPPARPGAAASSRTPARSAS